MSGKSVLKLGNSGGYWGDEPTALARQIRRGHLDYVTMDFLAEVTMSIMQKQRRRDPDTGYAKDFIPMLEDVLGDAVKAGTRIITNAGGVNPESCAQAIQKTAQNAGIKAKIAVVYGDDILDSLSELRAKGCRMDNMETGESFSDISDRVEAANVYFGAAGVVEALAWEPDVIITGRVTDTGITMAPMMHEFGWKPDEWDKLAAAVVAGHIIECGAQATGGNFTDWHKVPSFADIGYPVIEMNQDGTFVVTKHPNTGGLVSVDTIREQLFYEMGNPKAYITPDVVADFSTIQLESDGPDRVKVSGIKGYEPTDSYKVSMAYRDGSKCIGDIAVSGPDARKKAESFAKIFWDRVGNDFTATGTEYFGWNAFHRSLAHQEDGNEVLLRVGARDEDAGKLRTFAKALPGILLAGPPGVCVLGGVPRIRDVISYWPTLIPKSVIRPKIALYEDGFSDIQDVSTTKTGSFEPPSVGCQVAEAASPDAKTVVKKAGDPEKTPLVSIALGRSGDKGDTANIGIIARSEEAYKFLEEHLTAQVVKDLFHELCHGRVVRYSLPNLSGFNFLLESALGGGGTMTLRTDAQGKTFAQGLLRQRFAVPKDVLQASAD